MLVNNYFTYWKDPSWLNVVENVEKYYVIDSFGKSNDIIVTTYTVKILIVQLC